MTKDLDYAIRVIKATIQDHSPEVCYPYFFIVGAGISAPEIPIASEIIKKCKRKCKELDEISYIQFENETKVHENNPMKYYSEWIEFAYPNRIDRSNLFKGLNAKAKISSANLILAQILDSKKFANTVFTTNFDDSLKRALNLIGTKEFVSAENAMDNLVVNNHTKEIQIIHVHGTYKFYDCANLEDEITEVAGQSGTISSTRLLNTFLIDQAPIIVGYSGWESDVIMKCLKERISYPTPLRYIWVCHSTKNYDSLPQWLKVSNNIIFVVPSGNDENCDNGDYIQEFTENINESLIDATKFFKRLVYEFKIPTSTVLSNPYQYFSKTISELLPENEDVLHLRHWTQRLKLLEKNSGEFDAAVRKMEEFSLSKDYSSATTILHSFNKMPLSPADIEFIASLIVEFIDDRNTDQSADDRLVFRDAALDFVEHKLLALSNSEFSIRVLKAILFFRSAVRDKNKEISLIERIIGLSRKDSSLLEVELRALGLLSSMSDTQSEEKYLKELIARSYENCENKTCLFLKYKAYLELSLISTEGYAIDCINDAENILPKLNDPKYEVELCIQKAKILSTISDGKIRKFWSQQILNILQRRDTAYDKTLYINLAYSFLPFIKDFHDLDLAVLKEHCLIAFQQFNANEANCRDRLEHIRCCCILSFILQNEYETVKYANDVLMLVDKFPCECKEYLLAIRQILVSYFSVSSAVVSSQEKSSTLQLLKDSTGIGRNFWNLLEWLHGLKCLDGLTQYNADVASLEDLEAKLTNGLALYCDGNHNEAETLFVEVANSNFPYISEIAKTSLLYMIRRGETKTESSFWTTLEKKKSLSAFDYVNIILYCSSTGNKNTPHYAKAMEKMVNLTTEETKDLTKWWGDASIVGEYESKLVLALIHEKELP